MSTINERSLLLHEENRGKLRVESAVAITNADELSLAYTPGVAQPCLEIQKNPSCPLKEPQGNPSAVQIHIEY